MIGKGLEDVSHSEGTAPPALVAHRGYARRYPENTLEGVRAALEAGACYVEFDVQLSADGVPILFHDTDLRRTAGVEASIFDLSAQQLTAVEVNESDRLPQAFHGVRIPLLADTVRLLRDWPRVTSFVELKTESIGRFGHDRVLDRVTEVLEPILQRAVVISFDIAAVRNARARGVPAVGWVLPEWSAQTQEAALALGPEYIFCDHEIIPEDTELWTGSWRWVIYEVADAELALELHRRGADMIETMAVKELLEHPALAKGACR